MSCSRLSKKKLKECVKETAKEGIITCAVLRRIAEKMGATYKEAGKAADKLKIKVRNCDLGCF